jgi:hypothetical protein
MATFWSSISKVDPSIELNITQEIPSGRIFENKKGGISPTLYKEL